MRMVYLGGARAAAARAARQLVRFHDPFSHPLLDGGVIWLQPVLYVLAAWYTHANKHALRKQQSIAALNSVGAGS